jgi:hypothetical protein
MTELQDAWHDPRLVHPIGPGRTNLGREARASIALILVTIAVVLTISLVGLAIS